MLYCELDVSFNTKFRCWCKRPASVLFKHMSRNLRNQQGATGHILAMTRSGTTVWPCQTIYWYIDQYLQKAWSKKSFHYMLKSTVDFLSKFKRLVRASCDICNCQTAWLHHTTYLSESWKSYSPNQWKFFQKPRILQMLVVYLLLSNSGNFDQNGKENFVLTSQKISERNRSSWKVVQNF